MYSAVFESDNGQKYVFGKSGNTVFDMDVGKGMSVNIGMSQGFAQVGEMVQTQSVSGRQIIVKGVVYGNVTERKRAMRRVFAPFSSGRLVFEGKYYTRVYVKTAPTFSPLKDDGRFSMQLFAPMPFFYAIDEKSVFVGETLPMFRFPVNFSYEHTFGRTENVRYKTIFNDGDAKTPIGINIVARADSTNVTISNLETFDFFRICGIVHAGESVNVYRDENGILQVKLVRDGVDIDAIGMVDEESTLFYLNAGDNVIGVDSDEGGMDLRVTISFRPLAVALYEN